LFVAFFSIGALISAQETAPSQALSPAAQELVAMARAGVDESVLLTYVRTSSTPFGISAEDVVALQADGLPQRVISAALQRDSELRVASGSAAAGGAAAAGSPFSTGAAVTENQLFRMRFGYIFYGGKAYSGLDPYLWSVLWSDPTARVYLGSYDRQRKAGAILSWSGLGAILGGSVYGVVMGSQSSTNTNLNAGLAMGAVGAGLLSLLIGAVTQSESWRNLYNGMAQYNEDLIAGAGR
jgi:hypothetical protein